jgi:hypothetical protein
MSVSSIPIRLRILISVKMVVMAALGGAGQLSARWSALILVPLASQHYLGAARPHLRGLRRHHRHHCPLPAERACRCSNVGRRDDLLPRSRQMPWRLLIDAKTLLGVRCLQGRRRCVGVGRGRRILGLIDLTRGQVDLQLVTKIWP